jgi:hypothetical protein
MPRKADKSAPTEGWGPIAYVFACGFLHVPNQGFAQGCYPLHQGGCVLSRWWDEDEAVYA